MAWPNTAVSSPPWPTGRPRDMTSTEQDGSAGRTGTSAGPGIEPIESTVAVAVAGRAGLGVDDFAVPAPAAVPWTRTATPAVASAAQMNRRCMK